MNYVHGTDGAEVMFSSDAPDIIMGGDGSDAVHGGLGKDVFVVDGSDIKEFVMDFEDGKDLVDLRETGITSFEQLIYMYEYGTDIMETSVGEMRLYLTPMDNPDGRVDIDPTDFIFANTPVHTYSDGNNTVRLTDNSYSVHFGNAGTDTLDFARMSRAGVTLQMDDDQYSTGKFVIEGVTQHFFEFSNVKGTLGNDEITGSTVRNALIGRAGDDVLDGGRGNDVLQGNHGDDRLLGGEGRDMLAGGLGSDTLFGGSGGDTFTFYGADDLSDRVGDFQDGLDQLNVSNWGATSFDQLQISANGDGSLTVAYAAGNVSFTVSGSGLSIGDLNAGDFIFG